MSLRPRAPAGHGRSGPRTFDADASYCTSLVDSLEAHGVARRQAHPTDRRIKTVVLTPEGRRVLVEARTVLEQAPAAFLSLSDADQRTLRDLLARVAAADPSLARADPSPAGSGEPDDGPTGEPDDGPTGEPDDGPTGEPDGASLTPA